MHCLDLFFFNDAANSQYHDLILDRDPSRLETTDPLYFHANTLSDGGRQADCDSIDRIFEEQLEQVEMEDRVAHFITSCPGLSVGKPTMTK